jgi:di/tricarboxylate transporter
MSFATVLGGTCTLIGTSTNLVVSGLQEAKYGSKNPEYVFGFFTITPWGVPYAIWVRLLLLTDCTAQHCRTA